MDQKEIWFRCPKCNKKILKYEEKTGNSKDLYIKCKRCKQIIEVKID